MAPGCFLTFSCTIIGSPYPNLTLSSSTQGPHNSGTNKRKLEISGCCVKKSTCATRSHSHSTHTRSAAVTGRQPSVVLKSNLGKQFKDNNNKKKLRASLEALRQTTAGPRSERLRQATNPTGR